MPGGNKCAVFNCDNSRRNPTDKKIKYHHFPRDPHNRKQWIKALGRSEDWVPPSTLAVCSEHFTIDCYRYNAAGKILRLKHGSVPNVGDDSTQSKRLRLSVKSGEASSVSISYAPQLAIRESFKVKEATTLPVQSNESIKSNYYEMDTDFHDAESAAQALEFHTYASSKTSISTAVQTHVPRHSKGTMVRHKDLGLTKFPIYSPYHMTNDTSSSDTESDYEDEKFADEPSAKATVSSKSIKHLDSTYEDSNEGLVGSQERENFESHEATLPSESGSHFDDKNIVFSSCLLSLFQICQKCHRNPVVNISRRILGSLLSITTVCNEGHFFKWQSQPVLSGSSEVLKGIGERESMIVVKRESDV